MRLGLALTLATMACGTPYVRGPPLRVKVVDQLNWSPIAGATVLVQGYGQPQSSITNAGGLTAVIPIEDGLPFTLTATADGYEIYTRLGVPAPLAPETLLVELTK